MKTKIFLSLVILAATLFSSCGSKDYLDGLPEYENHYLAGYLPWNNDTVKVAPTAGLLEFPVQFHSEFSRDYDVDVKYFVKVISFPDIAKIEPAKLGVDYNITDKDGKVIAPNADGSYSLTFPNAIKGERKIYAKLLNEPLGAKARVFTINLNKEDKINSTDSESRINSKTSDYKVSTFTQAYRRTVKIQ